MEIVNPTPGTVETNTNYAGFWRRFGALLIDILILSVPTYFLATLLGDDPNNRGNQTTGEVEVQYFTIYHGVTFLVNWLYFALLESSARQATFGKQAQGLYVTDTDGRRITFVKATLRYFGKVISSLTIGIGYIMAAFTARKQALHDIIASTLVLHK